MQTNIEENHETIIVLQKVINGSIQMVHRGILASIIPAVDEVENRDEPDRNGTREIIRRRPRCVWHNVPNLISIFEVLWVIPYFLSLELARNSTKELLHDRVAYQQKRSSLVLQPLEKITQGFLFWVVVSFNRLPEIDSLGEG